MQISAFAIAGALLFLPATETLMAQTIAQSPPETAPAPPPGIAIVPGTTFRSAAPPRPVTPPKPVMPATLLDRQLEANDFTGLSKTLTAMPVLPRMTWLREKLLGGGTVFLAFPYIRDLWRLGEAVKDNNPLTDPRVQAATIWLYAYQLSLIDGTICDDASAPNGRRTSLLTGFRPVLAYLKTQFEDVRANAINTALRMELRTASRRGDDHFLCRGGLDEMTAALEQAGNGKMTIDDVARKLPAAPPRPGMVGRTVVLPPAVGYVPKFVARETYEPKQAELRTGMRARLLGFFK